VSSPPINLPLNAGSQWYRWEPHIHAPGTVLNDQFKGAWEDYLANLEKASPVIRAIGVTDYYSTETYERVLKAKAEGRLSACELIFPNIEMRLALGTVKGRWVNVHLLVSPEDPQHLDELKRFLKRLTFKAHGDSYACDKDDLIRLGKKCDATITHSDAALEHGSTQFKVSFNELRQIYHESAWAQANILVAVAGSEGDGTSGVREPADTTLRQEVEGFAHVIFASSAQQRDFWLGLGALPESDILAKYNALKPCMHGCDAHENRKVGVPDGDRYSWVKGAIAFDTLRQACIDPRGRAYVGTEPPISAPSSQVIASVEISNAAWAATKKLSLNPGLVAIIGARGSGKTALADMIALGCDAIPNPPSPGSFLKRASNLLGDAVVTLTWQAGESSARDLNQSGEGDAEDYPRARYLSQQFVEELCDAQEVTDTLMKEVERVIYNAHPISERDGAIDFGELLEARVSRHRESREREEEALAELSDRIGTELEKKGLVSTLKKHIGDKTKLIKGYETDRRKLLVRGTEKRVEQLNALTAAAEKVRSYLRYFAGQERAFLGLQDEVAALRTHGARETLRESQEKFKATQFKPDEWEAFLLDYMGEVDVTLTDKLAKVRGAIQSWKGTAPKINTDATISYIPENSDLEKLPLATLEAEIGRMEKLVSVDMDTAKKFGAISKRLTEEKTALTTLQEKLKDCEGAEERAKELAKEREATYQRIFDTVQSEQDVLADLYQPLMDRLQHAGSTLKKLSFTVTREVNLDAWAKAGEALFDLRQKSPFRGRGTLQQLASGSLMSAWQTEDSTKVTEAMSKFRAEHAEALLETSIVPKGDPRYRNWLKQFAKWLYSTDHIQIRYSVDYDGVDIRKLSPGTRGIVLLLLYLALDEDDDRPLIIDQPEENLDPKSIYDELVGLFLEAKKKRQVIMVTHNANLVVNTDADQIIIAESQPHKPGELPPIRYTSGGLEEAAIRKIVCDILEGGERAFQERARRLRVQLAR
jgi:hypothetical protein